MMDTWVTEFSMCLSFALHQREMFDEPGAFKVRLGISVISNFSAVADCRGGRVVR